MVDLTLLSVVVSPAWGWGGAGRDPSKGEVLVQQPRAAPRSVRVRTHSPARSSPAVGAYSATQRTRPGGGRRGSSCSTCAFL